MDISPDPELALFECAGSVLSYTSEEQLPLMVGDCQKKIILSSWKSPTPLCAFNWLNKMVIIIQMEGIWFK